MIFSQLFGNISYLRLSKHIICIATPVQYANQVNLLSVSEVAIVYLK